jgi:hypothetical protein
MLGEDEKVYLAESLERFLQTMPKSRFNRVKKILDKYMPTLHLAFAFSVVTYPRFVNSKVYAKLTNPKDDSSIQEAA